MADGSAFIADSRAAQGQRTPITATVERLADRVRVEWLRGGGADWSDDMVQKFGAFWQLDETAIIASYVIVGALARERGRYRVAQAAYKAAEVSLMLSAALGAHKPDPQLPPDWRSHFLPIIRQRHERDALVFPGGYYVVSDTTKGMNYSVRRRVS